MFGLGASDLSAVANGEADIWIWSATTNLGGLETTCVEQGNLQDTNGSI